MVRTTVALIATACLCAPMTPALGTPEIEHTVASVTAKQQTAKQRQTAKVRPPKRIKEVGTTVLLKKPTYTDAGRRVRVSVATRTRSGEKTTRRDVVVVRKKGKVSLEVTGRSWIRAEVRYQAQAAPGYKAYSKKLVYRTWQRTESVKVPATGANAAGFEWKDLMSGLLSAVAMDISETNVAGWAVGFLFSLGDNPKPDPLEDVKKQLEQITAQLEQINAKLDELSLQSAFQACALQTQLGTDAVATINTQAKQFRRYANPKNPNRDRKDWIKWANDVLDTRNGSLQRLEFLRLQLVSKGGAAGALEQCGDAFRKQWEQKYPALAEDRYYQDVWTYLNFFYQAQLLALDNVVEAYHLLAADAWMGTGPKPKPLPAPKDLKQICKNSSSNKAGASPSQYCDYAQAEATELYYAMLDQAKATGAAYAWNLDSQNAIAMRAGTSQLWVTDLNRAGDRSQCSGPVSSFNPCGPTVGQGTLMAFYKGLGYDGWRVANAAEWRTLLGENTKAATAGQAMDKAGFPSSMQRNLIVYSGETVWWDNSKMFWLSGTRRQEWQGLDGDKWGGSCFFDTNLGAAGDPNHSWLYCRDDQPFWYLANTYEGGGAGCYTQYHYRKSGLAQGGTTAAFYDVDLIGDKDSGCEGGDPEYFPPKVSRAPGWMVEDRVINSGASEFRWPVQDISNRKCLDHFNWGKDTSALRAKNAGGAYTMCGDDFKAWLTTQLPDPPQ